MTEASQQWLASFLIGRFSYGGWSRMQMECSPSRTSRP